MLSQLLISMTPSQLAMPNLQAAGNADPAVGLPSRWVLGGCLPGPWAASLGS